MENRFESTPPEGQQGWGAYATPPPYPGQLQGAPNLPMELSLCTRVRERLPYLLEDEGEISPQLIKELQGHLAVCPGCSQEFEESRQVIACLDAMPAAELPMDFSVLIQRRIQMQGAPVRNDAPARPLHAASSTGEAAVRTQVSATRQTVSTRQSLQTQTQMSLFQRLSLVSLFTAILAFFLSSRWGRAMLGENVATVRSWMNQMTDTLNGIPLLGRLTVYLFAALSQMGSLLGETYRSVGSMAVQGLTMDIALCLAAYYFLVARHQRDSMRSY